MRVANERTIPKYCYDSMDRMAEKTVSDVETSYTYSDTGLLTEVPIPAVKSRNRQLMRT